MEEILRELSDTELDAVSGGSAAAAATSSGDTAGAIASQSLFALNTLAVNASFFNSGVSAAVWSPGAAAGATF
jgi:hypothetical protein